MRSLLLYTPGTTFVLEREWLSMYNASTSTLPTGTMTFLYTDIVGSTKRWEAHPQLMKGAIERHDAILREAIEAHGGIVFRTEGDAFRAAFSTALPALLAAIQ